MESVILPAELQDQFGVDVGDITLFNRTRVSCADYMARVNQNTRLLFAMLFGNTALFSNKPEILIDKLQPYAPWSRPKGWVRVDDSVRVLSLESEWICASVTSVVDGEYRKELSVEAEENTGYCWYDYQSPRVIREDEFCYLAECYRREGFNVDLDAAPGISPVTDYVKVMLSWQDRMIKTDKFLSALKVTASEKI